MRGKRDTPFKLNNVGSAGGRIALKRIRSDPTDEEFRRKATQLIDSAKKEILVITGEIGAYSFPDLKWAAERARERGLTVKVYSSSPPPSVVNGLIAKGIEVYVGPKVRDHFLIVDSKSFIHSRPHRPLIGERAGEIYTNDPKAAAKLVKNFEQLVRKAKPQKKVDWKGDPLWKALQKPLDWKIDTHASRLDEEFA